MDQSGVGVGEQHWAYQGLEAFLTQEDIHINWKEKPQYALFQSMPVENVTKCFEYHSEFPLTNLAATAAKSLQSCPTLWDPIDGSPPGSPVAGILQARKLEGVAISFSNAWKWSRSVISNS